MPQGRYRLGIDIGGTFTDLALLDAVTGTLFTGKTLTTPDDPSEGVTSGLERLLERNGILAADVQTSIHATTLITNALIERKGAITGVITTKGFGDVLAIGRELRYDLYDLRIEMPSPLAPAELRHQVTERIRADGSVRDPLDENEVRHILRELVEAGAESVAVIFLHSYSNSVHEEAVERIAAADFPQLFMSSSYRVAREIREYERASTTTANAYVQPLASRYINRLEGQLSGLGLRGSLHLMASAGGTTSTATARERPITLTESGPAAGALVGGFYGTLAGERNVIAFDMGGTTAKACLIDDGRPQVTYQFETGRVHRFKKGSGLPLKVPAIDLIEIGAGGGSIARLDRLGLLKVGPDSAGADPGPASYGRGGDEPTVTDADLLLGYLHPDRFLGGEMRLDADAAHRAIRTRLAEPMRKSVAHVAWGIHEVVNEQMASAARVHIAERGRDPRRYALVATGGAGPVHAYRVAKKLGLKRVICPVGAGVASTVGLLVAPPQIDLVYAYVGRVNDIDWDDVNRIYNQMYEEATEMLAQLGVTASDVRFEPSADLRYVGQGFEVLTPLPPSPYGSQTAADIVESFEKAYRAQFGRTVPGLEIESLNWRLRASAPPTAASQVAEALIMPADMPSGNALRESRPVYFPESNGFTKTPVYDRYRIHPGHTFTGPAVVEERESTVVVGPGARCHVDSLGLLIVDLEDNRERG